MAIGNIADQTRFLKKELRTIIEDTAADQEKKFEERFSKLERKLHIVAKGTDGAIQAIQQQLASDKADSKVWRQELEQKFAKVVMKLGDAPAPPAASGNVIQKGPAK